MDLNGGYYLFILVKIKFGWLLEFWKIKSLFVFLFMIWWLIFLLFGMWILKKLLFIFCRIIFFMLCFVVFRGIKLGKLIVVLVMLFFLCCGWIVLFGWWKKCWLMFLFLWIEMWMKKKDKFFGIFLIMLVWKFWLNRFV